ncbi:MAG: ribonuclease III [Planctomycetes bacterium]|nr:ribonuclease III [Planctomycetota bacterium]MCB9911847.1 ribonuclease III [Planctomycetota bacterium]HPF13340.1 ribonuclease III [Planctomycetota bacterium]HRV80237.1 ribonuclease III [Planctomycetota bacterium]
MNQQDSHPARPQACLPPFKNPVHLELALTHASTDGPVHNERLEFLGDTVLDLVVAEYLYHTYPERPEGDLTQMKSHLVSRATLAEVARELGLQRLARVGAGLPVQGLSKAVMANLYEAVVGAVYLDQGLGGAKDFIHATLGERFVSETVHANEPVLKQRLQELCQRRYAKPPRYKLVETRGEAHARAFLVRADVGGTLYPSAWGRTKKEAESWAALEALLVLGEEIQ